MDPLQAGFFCVLAGIFALFFLIKGIRGLVRGELTRLSGPGAAMSWFNYSWARRNLGDEMYARLTGRSARTWSVAYTAIGVALVGAMVAIALTVG